MSSKDLTEDGVDSIEKLSEKVPTDDSQSAKKKEKVDMKENEVEDEKSVKPEKRDQELPKAAKGKIKIWKEKLDMH